MPIVSSFVDFAMLHFFPGRLASGFLDNGLDSTSERRPCALAQHALLAIAQGGKTHQSHNRPNGTLHVTVANKKSPGLVS